MKKNLLIKVLAAFFIVVGIIGCSKGPTNEEVKKLVLERKENSHLYLSLNIESNGTKPKINDKKVYSYIIKRHYIHPGGRMGYVSGCPEAQCCHDFEYFIVGEYLIGKNMWDEWSVYEVRNIERKELNQYWRPASQSLEEFYKDKLTNIVVDSSINNN